MWGLGEVVRATSDRVETSIYRVSFFDEEMWGLGEGTLMSFIKDNSRRNMSPQL